MPAPKLPMSCQLPRSEVDRSLLAAVLMKEDEELTAESLEGAVSALRRIHLRRELEQVQQELQAGISGQGSPEAAALDYA